MIEKVKVEILNVSNNPNPEYAHIGDSGMDIRAWIEDDSLITILPGETTLIHTGIFVCLPEGYEFQVRSRSGLSLNFQVIVLNNPGTIDTYYSEEIGLIVTNLGKETFYVHNGDRLAQLVLQKVPVCEWINISEEEYAKRKEIRDQIRKGGFGSTGID